MMNETKLTKNDHREHARQIAREAREKAKKAEKTKKIALWGTIILVIAVIGAIIAAFIGLSKASTIEASATSPGNMGTDGIILSNQTTAIPNGEYNLEDGTPTDSVEQIKQNSPENASKHHITVYLDYACPHCKDFEDANSEYLNKLLEKEQATIEYKPIAVIGSKLSFTGGNTAACVANYAPEQFLTIHDKLFTLTNNNQNASSSTVRPFIKDLNIPDETKQTIINCINSNVYGSWLNKATDNINLVKDSEGNNLVEGTPTILVDGIKYPFNPESFPQFFEELQTSGKTTQALIDEYSAKLGTSSTSDSQTSKTDVPADNSGE